MKKIIYIIFQAIVFTFSSGIIVFAGDGPAMIQRGNKLYRQAKYDEALKLYHQAQIKNPDLPLIEYNIGTARFKKGDYSAAINSFEKAAATKDKGLEAKANYNIANSRYKLGALKKNTDIGQAIKLYRESLDYYKRAVDLDPQDSDAKINHELVEKELKILIDQLKQQEDQKKDSAQDAQCKKETEDKKQDGRQKESRSEQEKSQQEQKEKQTNVSEEKQGAQEQEKKEREQAQEIEAESNKEEKKKEESASGETSAQQSKEMSAQEANMLLEGARQEENNSGRIDDRRQGREAEVLKNW